MPFVSVTRLRLQSIFFLFPFMRANEASVKALKAYKGFFKGKELIDKHFTFWTITFWEDEASMKTFRVSPEHRAAMQNLAKWWNEASYHHWTQDENEFPSWQSISEKLYAEGRLSKVKYPSKAQTENQFPPIKWTKIERVLKS